MQNFKILTYIEIARAQEFGVKHLLLVLYSGYTTYAPRVKLVEALVLEDNMFKHGNLGQITAIYCNTRGPLALQCTHEPKGHRFKKMTIIQ